MNRIYHLIWNGVRNAWVTRAETARRRGKGASPKLVAAVLSLSAFVAHAAPVGGAVVSGAGSIAQYGATTTVTQSSPNLSLNWKSFNIAPQETANFQQPSASAIAVNRIFDTNGTQILGRINANGQVWLINPNGILFGQGAQVNVGGLVASTLELNAGLNGNARSFSGSGSGSVVNQGTINAASGGYVALLGNHVSNQGTITAHLGAVALGAGSAATLTFSGNSLVRMQVDQSVLNSVAENGGLIRADGGMVVMTAGAKDVLLASVVNNTGVIEARTVEHREGTIILLGGMAAGSVNVGGTLDGSAPNGGNGGFIETSAASVNVARDARVTTAAPVGIAGTWLIDPVDFTIAAAGGDMTGATLSANLGGGNVVIQSTSGAVGTAGDVNVNDVVAWSANKLTLNAQNNININANLNGSGTASLALEFGQGAVAAGNTSNVITTGAAVTLPASTTNFTTKKGSDGVVKTYTVITSLGAAGSVTGTDLQGMSGGLATNYALGANIPATATSGWNSGAGFAPVGNSGTAFTGIFDGLGHTITSLTINRGTSYVGLFGQTNTGSVIQNLGMVGGTVRGGDYVGGLVGNNSGGVITNSYATATLNSTGAYLGGLVGNNTGTITNSYAISAINGGTNVGGLVGRNQGTIQGSYAAGTLLGSNRLGGLVGVSSSTIVNSYSTVAVTSNFFVQDLFGGLVGQNSGPITNSYASGVMVVNPSSAGGLIGSNSGGVITNSYWNTQVTGQATSSGGTGRTTAQMRQESNFTSWDFTSMWTIYEGITYPLLRSLMVPLTVTANNHTRTYTGVGYSGGNGVTYSTLVNGIAPAGTLSFSGTSQGKTALGSYVITPGGLQSNQQYRITLVDGTLTINKALLTVTADNASRLYGQVNPTFTATLSGFVNSETASTAAGFSGSASVTSTATATTSVGTTVITAGIGTLAATNYDFTPLVDGILTIGKAHLTVTADDKSRLYGQANPALTTSLSGFVNGENVGTAAGLIGSGTASTTATTTTNVGTAVITAGTGTLAATNYDFTNLVNGTLTIGQAHLTVTADDKSRLYGQANPALTTSLSGFVNGENAGTAAGLIGSGTASTTATTTTNVGTAVITAGTGTLAATNYDFTNLVNGTLTIGQAPDVALAPAAALLANPPTPSQSLLDALAHLESDVLRFPAVAPTVPPGGSTTITVTRESSSDTGAVGDASSSGPCTVADVKLAICIWGGGGPFLKIVDQGMRLAGDEIKAEK